MRGWLVGLLMLGAASVVAEDKLVGASAPEWRLAEWQNSTPLKLADLKGKVVLVRWWTAPQCTYCSATAPALNEFYQVYHEKGLEIVGAYHHKSTRPLKLADVKAHSERFGFKFPVAIDPEWRTLREWWLNRGERDFTSVTFLLDRQGVIRHIHPGGQYVKGDADYAAMKAAIERLLAEK
ncbi:MAG: TlpA disulfide reductase family protein [Verrucomicrobiota bacterium]